jgi:hypothetical protein
MAVTSQPFSNTLYPKRETWVSEYPGNTIAMQHMRINPIIASLDDKVLSG